MADDAKDAELQAKVAAQGDQVRSLKSKKASKVNIQNGGCYTLRDRRKIDSTIVIY